MGESAYAKATSMRLAFASTNYRIETKLGEGAFGQIYSATWNGDVVAIKVEDTTRHIDQLEEEFSILQRLQSGVGIPEVYRLERVGTHKAMVMELLGQDIHSLFNACRKHFSPPFILQLGLQMLTRLEFIHSRGIIHRDLKPDNFLLGLGLNSRKVYLVDFGISKQYKYGLEHAPFRTNVALRGTAKYCSVNTHKGFEQSRRDDLESLAYVLLQLVHGKLPWDDFKHHDKEVHRRGVCNLKTGTALSELCGTLPEEFQRYISYCRALAYDARPDYKYLKRLFLIPLETMGEKWLSPSLELPYPESDPAKEEKVDQPPPALPMAA